MHILLFVLVGGLLIKFFTISFLNKERMHFSFDERRYFNDEKSLAKVMRMKLQVKERVFFVVMIVLYLAAIIVYFSGNNEFGIWLLMSVVILQLVMNMVTDFSLYRTFYDKANLVMLVIWLFAIVGVVVLTNVYII